MSKGGMTPTIRVSPKDCISILDILDVAGISRQGMSFASCTSLALSSLIGMAQQAGIIEEPDGFDYLEKVGPYHGQGNNKVKRAVSDNLYNAAQHGLSPPVLPRVAIPMQVAKEQELREWKDRLSVLNNKIEAEIPLTDVEKEEWNQGLKVLYPEG